MGSIPATSTNQKSLGIAGAFRVFRESTLTLPVVVSYRPLRFPIRLFPLQGLALVVMMLALADTDLEFRPTSFEIKLGGDQGVSPLLDPLGNLADFIPVEQKLA